MLPLAFDDRPFGWLLVSLAGLALVLGLTAWFFWKKAPVRLPDWLVVVAGLGLLIWARLPVLLYNLELNPDESQMISHAITLARWPVYWRSVDGTTIGPLDCYALLLPRLVGLGFDYTAARVLGLLCIGGSLAFLFGALRRFFGSGVARLVWLPALLLLSFTQNPDLVHYSSEHVPLVLLAGALFLFARSFSENRTPAGRAFLTGLLLGMVPFGKLQGVPPAAIVALFAALTLWRQRNGRGLAALVAGGLAFPLAVVLWAAANGVLGDFYTFYLLGNAQYGTNKSLWESARNLFGVWLGATDFVFFSLLTALWLLALVFWGKMTQLAPSNARLGAFIGLLLLTSGYAAARSGFPFGHYLHWLVAPLTLLNGWLLSALLAGQTGSQPRTALLVLGVGTLLTLGPFLAKLRPGVAYNACLSTPNQNRAHPRSAVSRAILALQPGDGALVVWGWQCRFYVESGLPQGTAENHTERCIFPIELRPLYRRRLLTDFQRTKPAVFVDAVGRNSWWVQDRATQGHECFPELAALIQARYRYVGTVDECRIYARATP
jgi:hypothetical protein